MRSLALRVARLAGPLVGALVVAACVQPAPISSQAGRVSASSLSASSSPLATGAQAPAQPAAAASVVPFVRMRWNGAEVRIDYEGKAFRYRFDGEPYVDDARKYRQRPYLYRIDQAETVKLLEKAGVVYLLVHVQGPSRGPEGAMHYCGAGQEEGLVLLAFNRNGEVKPPEFALTRSCWITIEAGDSDFHGSADGHLVGDLQYFESSSADAGLNETVDVHVAFDPDRPEAGLMFVQRLAPMPPLPVEMRR